MPVACTPPPSGQHEEIQQLLGFAYRMHKVATQTPLIAAGHALMSTNSDKGALLYLNGEHNPSGSALHWLHHGTLAVNCSRY